jgi:hypothetical protein
VAESETYQSAVLLTLDGFDLLYIEFVMQEVVLPLLVLNRLHSYNKDASLFF